MVFSFRSVRPLTVVFLVLALGLLNLLVLALVWHSLGAAELTRFRAQLTALGGFVFTPSFIVGDTLGVGAMLKWISSNSWDPRKQPVRLLLVALVTANIVGFVIAGCVLRFLV